MQEETGKAGGAEVLVKDVLNFILKATVALRTKNFVSSRRRTILQSSPYGGFHNLYTYYI